jgi:FkbH-like protein
MALAETLVDNLTFAEDIRLIIWDLDETFWDGTLTEGGISYRMDHHQLVIDLAKRGIMSAICSKNERTPVEALLQDKGLWPYIIFPSIDWTPKGPRIKTMLNQIGLRPESVLFLDDNPMNLAQAAHMNPGLNTAMPDIIAYLADARQVQGKPDANLTRLAQYKVKERKAQAAEKHGDDTTAFLRKSGVKVFIEHDVEAHLDRAIELINRTNQLNFTKSACRRIPLLRVRNCAACWPITPPMRR